MYFYNEQACASTYSAGGEALLRGGYASHMWLLSDDNENGTTKFPKVFFFQIYKLFMFCPIYLVTFPVFFHSVPFPIHPLSWSPHVCIHNIYTCYYTHLWRRKWQPTPAFLPGESRGQRSLAGCSPWGHKKSDMTEQLSTYVSTYYYFLSHLRVNWRLVPFHP